MENRVLKFFLLFSFFRFITGHLKAAQCPDSFLISPCVCTNSGGILDLQCTGLSSLQSLIDIFARTFPTNEFRTLTITQSQLGALSNDIFREKSFEIIEISNNRAVSFENTQILSSSKSRLTSLKVIQDTDYWVFDFSNVVDYNLLGYLEISGYNVEFRSVVTNIPALKTLILRSFTLTTPPSLNNLPSLETVDLDGNSITTLAENSFSILTSIKTLYLGHNKLVNLNSSSIVLTGPVDFIDLTGNLINSVAPGFISGVSSATTLLMINNYIYQLPEDIFRPFVELFTQGSGKLLIDGNPLECGCDIAWIILNNAFLNTVPDGRCVNGTKFQNLNANYYLENC